MQDWRESRVVFPNMWKSKQCSVKTKGHLCGSNVMSILVYSSRLSYTEMDVFCMLNKIKNLEL